jgi:hypothetical protein
MRRVNPVDWRTSRSCLGGCLYVQAGRKDTEAALLVMIGALTEGRKVVLTVEKQPTGVAGILVNGTANLRARGLRP